MAREYKRYCTRLSCNHMMTTKYLPPGTELLCRTCWQVGRVVTCSTRWYWHCTDCPKTRYYLARRLQGERDAIAHKNRHDGHHVTFYDPDGRSVWSSHPNDNIQLELDFPPPTP